MKTKTAALLASLCLLAGLPCLQAQQKEVYATVNKRLEAGTEKKLPVVTQIKKMAKTENEKLRAYTSQRQEARTERKIFYEK